MLFLLPLPLVARWRLPSHRAVRPAIRIPFFQKMARLTGQQPESGSVIHRRNTVQAILYAVIWCAVVVALAKPQWLKPPIVKALPTRDLLLAVDLSGSMETEDVKGKDGKPVARLTAVKQVLGDFLMGRKGDRVGLLVFGTAAFVQVPFTQDLDVCLELINETAPRMAGPKTALGDAVGLGITLFERSTVSHRVMIVLTDGNDTGSRVPPTEAARVAKDNGITIHTIAFGDPAAVGEELFDQQTLKSMATITDGQYFYAADRQALAQIYAELDRIETRKVNTISHRPRLDLYYWPLSLALVLSTLYHLVMAVRQRHRIGKLDYKKLSTTQ
ncbi:MAG: VWA domain-containing protein [Desulfatitalea sp.]|nr:VWA domain-containing protein [Desulfatitalea sp.]